MAFWFGSSTLTMEDFTASPTPASDRSSARVATPAAPRMPMGQTDPATRPASARKDGFALGLATPGARVGVTEITGNNPALEKRLEAMGIRVGSALEVLQHEGGSVIVRIGTTRLALGVSMAHRLRVASLDLH